MIFLYYSKVFQSKDEMMKSVVELAATIASKSPVAVQSTKHNLNYSRDHSVAESLEYMVRTYVFSCTHV